MTSQIRQTPLARMHLPTQFQPNTRTGRQPKSPPNSHHPDESSPSPQQERHITRSEPITRGIHQLKTTSSSTANTQNTTGEDKRKQFHIVTNTDIASTDKTRSRSGNQSKPQPHIQPKLKQSLKTGAANNIETNLQNRSRREIGPRTPQHHQPYNHITIKTRRKKSIDRIKQRHTRPESLLT
ncbi:unnamed protein product [Arabidopsis thaliana]|uniref:Uncharacterized protein n=1 Tax=Arabidopsis thaliana TaxID=3702 RepID=A0A5S9WXV9_ARATH|nr:unnamed protein product [Arabidopsis thaliana]